MQAVWVEIPVKDLDRALAFYRAVFKFTPTEMLDDGTRRTNTMINTGPEGQPGISLNQTANFEPSRTGTLVYLDTGEDLTAHLGRIELAGGSVVEPKTSMGDAGNYATFIDSEGNLLALYSYG